MGQPKRITAKLATVTAHTPGRAGKAQKSRRPTNVAILFMTDRRRILHNRVPGQPAPDILPHIDELLAKLPHAIGKEVASSKAKTANTYRHSQTKWDKEVRGKIAALDKLKQTWDGKLENKDTSKVVGAEWLLAKAFEPAVHEEYMANAKAEDDKFHADNPGYVYEPAPPGAGKRNNITQKNKRKRNPAPASGAVPKNEDRLCSSFQHCKL